MHIIWVIVGLGVLLLIYMWQQAFQNRVQTKVIQVKNKGEVSQKLTLFFISDIHRRVVKDTIINQIKGKTDLIIIGGDLTEKGVPFSRVSLNLKKLSEIAPVYFIWGNNDFEVERQMLLNIMGYYGVKELKNDVAYLNYNGFKIALIGVNDFSDEAHLPNMNELLPPIPEAYTQIMIGHNPEIIHSIPETHSIELLLSGHTHGGQIRVLGLGPYKKGEWKVNKNMQVLISNGYGTTLLPLRLGAKPETHLITIQTIH